MVAEDMWNVYARHDLSLRQPLRLGRLDGALTMSLEPIPRVSMLLQPVCSNGAEVSREAAVGYGVRRETLFGLGTVLGGV